MRNFRRDAILFTPKTTKTEISCDEKRLAQKLRTCFLQTIFKKGFLRVFWSTNAGVSASLQVSEHQEDSTFGETQELQEETLRDQWLLPKRFERVSFFFFFKLNYVWFICLRGRLSKRTEERTSMASISSKLGESEACSPAKTRLEQSTGFSSFCLKQVAQL